jgi:hypothetical protein
MQKSKSVPGRAEQSIVAEDEWSFPRPTPPAPAAIPESASLRNYKALTAVSTAARSSLLALGLQAHYSITKFPASLVSQRDHGINPTGAMSRDVAGSDGNQCQHYSHRDQRRRVIRTYLKQKASKQASNP